MQDIMKEITTMDELVKKRESDLARLEGTEAALLKNLKDLTACNSFGEGLDYFDKNDEKVEKLEKEIRQEFERIQTAWKELKNRA